MQGENIVSISTGAGAMQTYCAYPANAARAPAVVIFMDVWGVREELYQIARQVAQFGYCCYVPDFYYRMGKLRFDARNAEGRVISVARLDARMQEKMHDAICATPNDQVMEDTRALLRHVDSDPRVRGPLLGAVGYCMGGRHAMCAAVRFPQRFRAVASLHGTALVSERRDSPHYGIDRMRGEFYCGFGAKDPHTPPEMVERLAQLMRAAGVAYHHEVHAGAAHGYALPERDVYDEQATRRDWERIHAMFDRRLS